MCDSHASWRLYLRKFAPETHGPKGIQRLESGRFWLKFPTVPNTTCLRSGPEFTIANNWYNCYTIPMRFTYDPSKREQLKKKRGIDFDEVQELFYGPYYLDKILDDPEQWVAIGWVKGLLWSVVYEEREDQEGVYYHLVTLWKSTKAERLKYEEHS